MSKFNELYEVTMNIDGTERDWSQAVNIKKGKMRKLLKIPAGKLVSDMYTDGSQLASDLLRAVNGNKKEASSMLSYVANIDDTNNVLDKALHAIKKL
jgi:hypothetical protein